MMTKRDIYESPENASDIKLATPVPPYAKEVPWNNEKFISDSVVVNAPPLMVWNILAVEGHKYRDWHPFITSMDAIGGVGARVCLQFKDGNRMDNKMEVVSVEPGQEFTTYFQCGRKSGWFVRVACSTTLESLPDGKTLVKQQIRLGGFLARFFRGENSCGEKELLKHLQKEHQALQKYSEHRMEIESLAQELNNIDPHLSDRFIRLTASKVAL